MNAKIESIAKPEAKPTKAKAKTKAKVKANSGPEDTSNALPKAEVKPVVNTRLLRGLVTNPTTKKTKKGKVTFIDAMGKMGISSVFDIIRQPKSAFVERLGKVCDADGALAYDNALCYAGQIGSLYREHRVSSGKDQQLTQRTGVRALVDVGPSYPNLFKENWDEFCKVGALAALDGPVAYLNSIYRLATKTLEVKGQGTKPKILLDTRRPDLKDLLIDHDSTFKARPMLELVNDVLTAGIKRYLQDKPDKDKPIYDILAERRHPFIFPYNFAHHQCLLGLGGKKPALGELNYRISLKLPINQRSENDYGAVQNSSFEAQRLLSGLSPQQQKLLIEPSMFTTFYLSKATLQAGWQGPGTSYSSPHTLQTMGYLVLPGQPTVINVNPAADTLIDSAANGNTATLLFSKAGASDLNVDIPLYSSTPASTTKWRLNHLHSGSSATISPWIAGPATFPANSSGYSCTFSLTAATGTVTMPLHVMTRSVTLVLDEFFTLSDEQRDFFQRYFGVYDSEPLVSLKTFLQQTDLEAEQVEALLSQRTHYPRLSPNCPTTNLQIAKEGIAGHYGSCYVNGHGSDRYDTVQPPTTASLIQDKYDNAMGLKEVKEPSGTSWYLTKTSLNRFDRLQRMIRLQRWMDIPFAQLDTLVVSAMRSEGANNLTLDFNRNTLRVLGVYRYLSQRYKIGPEEFAAFMHDISPYATGERMPLLDEVFNKFSLFDTSLVLDQKPFSIDNPDADSRKTLAQLSAGLGLPPESLRRLAAQTQEYVTLLKHDLSTVSSIYRQARVAQLFGLSVEELLALVDLLGGEDYQRVLCRGALSHPSAKMTGQVTFNVILNGQMRLELNLFVDLYETTGSFYSLLPGSTLQVFMGWDFVTANTDRRFTTVNSDPFPARLEFLRNADGTTLTLDPLPAVGGISVLSGKKLDRMAFSDLFNSPQIVKALKVKCGDLPERELRVLSLTRDIISAPTADMLDLLMQLDWVVTWLKDSKQKVVDVLHLLGVAQGDFLPREGLTDRLTALAEATRGAVITDAQIQALNLPTHESRHRKSRAAGDPIDWRQELLPLLDAQGLVLPLALELVENTLAQLQAQVELALNNLNLTEAQRAQCVEKLSNLLLAGHDRQLRLIEGLAQEMINLPMDRAQVVLHWAQTSVHALLSAVLKLGSKKSPDVSDPDPLLVQLQRVMRYGKAAVHLQLSTGALRLFSVRPDWLRGLSSDGLVLSLKTLYLLGSYNQWFSSQSQAEESLLGYFILANPAKAQLKTKALRNAVNEEAATALASLLGWSKDEISALFELLPQKRACTMAEVDWIRRCQTTGTASGLSVTDLLRATALHTESSNLDWQAVGEAAVAASR
jgi:hypothetical protein